MSEPRYYWWKLKRKGRLLGYRIVHLEAATSTNDVAKELAHSGAKEGLVIIAESQSRGRGRRGAVWVSPRGGLWLSVILRPALKPEEVPRMAIVGAVAVAEAVEQLLGLRPRIKWPNDLLLGGKKFCGILAESSIKGDRLEFVVLGVGINANVELDGLPEGVRESATSLSHELGRPISRRRLLEALLDRLEYHYRLLLQGRFLRVLEKWKTLDITLGRRVVALSPEGRIVGEAVDVDRDGSLILRSEDGSLIHLRSEEVRLIKVEEGWKEGAIT